MKKLLRKREVTRSLRTRVSEMKNWPYAQVNSEAKNLFLHEKRHPSLSSDQTPFYSHDLSDC